VSRHAVKLISSRYESHRAAPHLVRPCVEGAEGKCPGCGATLKTAQMVATHYCVPDAPTRSYETLMWRTE